MFVTVSSPSIFGLTVVSSTTTANALYYSDGTTLVYYSDGVTLITVV